MSNWNECEGCKSASGGYANGMRCLKHQVEVLRGDGGFVRVYESHMRAIRPKSDMEVIIEMLGKIEERLSKLEKCEEAEGDEHGANVEKFLEEIESKMLGAIRQVKDW